MPAGHPVTELREVIAGRAEGRVDDRQITLFDGVGFAIEDFSALRFIYNSVAQGGASNIDLLAAPADPKNLFDLVK